LQDSFLFVAVALLHEDSNVPSSIGHRVLPSQKLPRVSVVNHDGVNTSYLLEEHNIRRVKFAHHSAYIFCPLVGNLKVYRSASGSGDTTVPERSTERLWSKGLVFVQLELVRARHTRGFNPHNVGDAEHGLETDSLFACCFFGLLLSTASEATDSKDVVLGKPVFVRVEVKILVVRQSQDGLPRLAI
jgi:hypothetical protein